jgi:uncharacterized membrane protein YhiD involved in acid resistance
MELFAHAGVHVHGGAELAAVAVAALVIPLIVLAVVGRMFWRAAKRDSERGTP